MCGGRDALAALLEPQRRKQRFVLYQLQLDEENAIPFAFKDITALKAAGYEQPPAAMYYVAGSGEIYCPAEESDDTLLKRLFADCRERLPEGCRGRPMAVSDVVEPVSYTHLTEEIIEAHDMDKYNNKMTMAGASKIYLMAQKHGMNCRRLTWNPNYKGFDDWQLALRQGSQRQKEIEKLSFKEQYLRGLCKLAHIEDCVEQDVYKRQGCPRCNA